MTASNGTTADDISVAASAMPTLNGRGQTSSPLGEANKLDFDDKRSATSTLDESDSGVVRSSAAIKEIDESAVFAYGEDKCVSSACSSCVARGRQADARSVFLLPQGHALCLGAHLDCRPERSLLRLRHWHDLWRPHLDRRRPRPGRPV